MLKYTSQESNCTYTHCVTHFVMSLGGASFVTSVVRGEGIDGDRH